jgi:hypothetical protein
MFIHTHTHTHTHTNSLIYTPGASCIRQHTSAYVSIRQHTSAYVSIRQHTSALFELVAMCGAVCTMLLQRHNEAAVQAAVEAAVNTPRYSGIQGLSAFYSY